MKRNPPRNKIVICAVRAGGGHIAAMEGLSSLLKSAEYPHPVETFTSSEEELGKLHETLYTKLPWVYKFGYPILHSPWGKNFERLSTHKFMRRFMRELEPHFAPDSDTAVIVSTHFLMTRALLALRARYPESPVRLVGFVPDFDRAQIHVDRFRGKVLDGVIARNPELLERLHKHYALPKKFLSQGGFLPSPAFSQARQLTPEQARRDLAQAPLVSPGSRTLQSIDPDLMTIVVAGGSGWSGRIASKVEALLNHPQLAHSQYQILVVTGGSAHATGRYQKLQERFPTAQIILLPRLTHQHLALAYRGADLVWLAGLAPATLFELIETDVRPILLSYVHPGQEQENLQYALERGLLHYAPRKAQAIAEIVSVHKNLAQLRANRQLQEPRYYQVREELLSNNQRITQLLTEMVQEFNNSEPTLPLVSTG